MSPLVSVLRSSATCLFLCLLLAASQNSVAQNRCYDYDPENPYQQQDIIDALTELLQNNEQLYAVATATSPIAVDLDYSASRSFADEYGSYIRYRPYFYNFIQLIDRINEMVTVVGNAGAVDGTHTFSLSSESQDFTIGDLMFYTDLARFQLAVEANCNEHSVGDAQLRNMISDRSWLDIRYPSTLNRIMTAHYQSFRDYVMNLSD